MVDEIEHSAGNKRRARKHKQALEPCFPGAGIASQKRRKNPRRQYTYERRQSCRTPYWGDRAFALRFFEVAYDHPDNDHGFKRFAEPYKEVREHNGEV